MLQFDLKYRSFHVVFFWVSKYVSHSGLTLVITDYQISTTGQFIDTSVCQKEIADSMLCIMHTSWFEKTIGRINHGYTACSRNCGDVQKELADENFRRML